MSVFRRTNRRWPLTWTGDVAAALLLAVAGISWWVLAYATTCLLRGCS